MRESILMLALAVGIAGSASTVACSKPQSHDTIVIDSFPISKARAQVFDMPRFKS